VIKRFFSVFLHRSGSEREKIACVANLMYYIIFINLKILSHLKSVQGQGERRYPRY